MPSSIVLLAAMPLAWLVPNHYFPWAAAWQDGAALALLAAAMLAQRGALRLPAAWLLWCFIALASIGFQSLVGTIRFGGDALIAGLYVLAFGLAVAFGTALAQDRTALDAFALGLLAAALASTGIALAQWLGLELGLYAVALKPGGRPYANLAQPNQFCSAAFLGLCAVALLFERRRIGATGAALAASLLLTGMLTSASRTGWMQIGTALVMGLLARRRFGTRLSVAVMLGFAGVFFALSLSWPTLSDALLAAESRPLAEQAQGGVRLRLWQAMSAAVWREPLSGYGWQQVSLAQLDVALDGLPLRRHFEHAHNLVLDLILWAGVVVGGILVLIGAVNVARLLRAQRDSQSLWLAVMVLGLLLHAMVEFPLEYAYLLLPFGVALGALHGIEGVGGGWKLPAQRWAGAAFAALLSAVAVEYLEAEQNHRLLRLESARIGVMRIESEAPSLHLLTQLGAFLSFARTEARPGMLAVEVVEMQRVAERFAYPPALLRLALAQGLNGQSMAARDTLARLCSVHPKLVCDDARAAWVAIQERYPTLRDVIPP